MNINNPLKNTIMFYAFLLAIYVVGCFIAYKRMEEWKHSMFEKVAFSLIWPLVAILYCIHYLHNK